MPSLSPLPAFALVFGAGAAANWLAWRVRIPAILLLLTTGFVCGPVLGLLSPEQAFGTAFRPIVSLAVGLILFEGGMTLEFAELRGTGNVVRNLVTVGAAVTWGLTTAAGVLLAGFDLQLALLVGALLVLTGPTVVVPLVRHVRPRAPLGPVLRWEGILIDPIGAALALLVLEALAQGHAEFATIATTVLTTVAAGGGIGFACGHGVARLLERFLVPDMLHVPVTFGAVTTAFVAANSLQPESGLLATTVMGIVLANRKNLDIGHVYDWHEQLVTILLSMLFVTIAARVPLAQWTGLGWRAVAFAAALVVVVRPLAVLLSTLRSDLKWRERAFLMAMAPRGIVVAAVCSEFSLHLEQAGQDRASSIVALVFPTIVLTVLVYGLAAAPLAKWLGVAERDPQGALIVGADTVGRAIGEALRGQGIEVLMVDTNATNATAARTSGLRTWHGSALSQRFAAEADFDGIGKVLAMTPSDEVNRLTLGQMLPMFGRAHLFALAGPRPGQPGLGRRLFRDGTSLDTLAAALRGGARLRATKLTDQFGPAEFTAHHGEEALVLFVIDDRRALHVVTADAPAELRAGVTVISLAAPAAGRGEDDPTAH